MEVVLDLRTEIPHATLRAPGDFGRFHAVLVGKALGESDFQSLGIRVDGDHAWIPVELVRRLAGEAATPEWSAGLASMVDFARAHGWYDESAAAILGHVERQA